MFDEPRQRTRVKNAPEGILERSLPPHSIPAEQGILGCILLDPQAIHACYEKLKLPDVFYDMRHGALFEVVAKLVEEGKPVDAISVQQRLKDTNQLEAIGGLSYLSALMDVVPSAANIGYYIDIVREKYILRGIIQACTNAIGKAYENEGDVDTILDTVEADILAIGQTRTQKGEDHSIKDLVFKALDNIERMHQRQGALSGLASGFPDLDKLTGGFQPADMIVVAARPGGGKTTLGMNFVEHIALECNVPIGIFSLEMSADSLVTRMLGSRGKVNLKNIADGFMMERDFPKLKGAAESISKSKIYIDDRPGLNLMQIKAKARRWRKQHGIKMFVVDYLQLISVVERNGEKRNEAVGKVSTGLKNLARELGIPGIIIAQLNRDLEKERNRKPRPSDLKDSGSIEQDADLILLLYRPNEDEAHDAAAHHVGAILAKQRNGPTGEFHLTFLKGYTRFESAARVYDEPQTKNPYKD